MLISSSVTSEGGACPARPHGVPARILRPLHLYYVPHLTPAGISFLSWLTELRAACSHTRWHHGEIMTESSLKLHAAIQISPATYFLLHHCSLMLFVSFHPRQSSWHRIRLMVRLSHVTAAWCCRNGCSQFLEYNHPLMTLLQCFIRWFLSAALVFDQTTQFSVCRHHYNAALVPAQADSRCDLLADFLDLLMWLNTKVQLVNAAFSVTRRHYIQTVVSVKRKDQLMWASCLCFCETVQFCSYINELCSLTNWLAVCQFAHIRACN